MFVMEEGRGSGVGMIDLPSVEGVIVVEGGIKMFVACSRPKK